MVGGERAGVAEGALVLAEHQHMALLTVLEVVVNTFLLAQALDEVQVTLVVLHAVIALGVDRGTEEELVAAQGDAVLLQHLSDDLRHRQVLKDALVIAQGQVAQLRHHAQGIAGQALAGFALGNLDDQAVNPRPLGAEGEKSRLMQQALQVEVGALADQFQLEAIRLTDGAKCIVG